MTTIRQRDWAGHSRSCLAGIAILIVATLLACRGTASQAQIVLNGSFEDPHQNSAIYLFNAGTNFTDWTVGGADAGSRSALHPNGVGVGFNVDGTLIQTPAADGTQYAWLQGATTLSQTILLPTAPAFRLTFFVGGRNGDQVANGGTNDSFEVTLDGTSVLASGFAPYNGTALVGYTNLFAATAGTHTLTLLNASPFALNNADSTVGFDAVSIVAVPEPSLAVLLGIGAAALWLRGEAGRNECSRRLR